VAVHALVLITFNPHCLFNPVYGTYFFDETLAARPPQSVWDSFYSQNKQRLFPGIPFIIGVQSLLGLFMAVRTDKKYLQARVCKFLFHVRRMPACGSASSRRCYTAAGSLRSDLI